MPLELTLFEYELQDNELIWQPNRPEYESTEDENHIDLPSEHYQTNEEQIEEQLQTLLLNQIIQISEAKQRFKQQMLDQVFLSHDESHTISPARPDLRHHRLRANHLEESPLRPDPQSGPLAARS